MHGIVFIKSLQFGIHGVYILPCGRNQQAHGTKNIHTTGQQGLKHIIHAIGIGTTHGHQWTDIFHIRDQRSLKFVSAGY